MFGLPYLGLEFPFPAPTRMERLQRFREVAEDPSTLFTQKFHHSEEAHSFLPVLRGHPNHQKTTENHQPRNQLLFTLFIKHDQHIPPTMPNSHC